MWPACAESIRLVLTSWRKIRKKHQFWPITVVSTTRSGSGRHEVQDGLPVRGSEHDGLLPGGRRPYHRGGPRQLWPLLNRHLQPPRPDGLERQLHGPRDDQYPQGEVGDKETSMFYKKFPPIEFIIQACTVLSTLMIKDTTCKQQGLHSFRLH